MEKYISISIDYKKSRFLSIIKRVQCTVTCHERFLNYIMSMYEKVPFRKFIVNYIMILRLLFQQPFNNKNNYTTRGLTFFVKTCLGILKVEGRNKSNDNATQFIRELIPRILKYTDGLRNISFRISSMKFINILLSEINNFDSKLDDNVRDAIKNKMLSRLKDKNIHIVLQAISSLSYFQHPTDPLCPVAETLSKYLDDPNEDVRHGTIKILKINHTTSADFIRRTDDTSATVRNMLYRRLYGVDPRDMQVEHRIRVLESGFDENHRNVELAFHKMLRKWLSVYGENYVDFLKSVHTTSSEENLDRMKKIGELIMDYFLKLDPIEDFIQILSAEDKFVHSYNNREMFLFWKCLINHIRSSEDFKDYVKDIIPGLQKMCSYIFGFVTGISRLKMTDFGWNNLQFVLLNLFEIVEGYNFADEYDRHAVRTIVNSSLSKCYFSDDALMRVVPLYFKACTNVEEINQLVTNICEANINLNFPEVCEIRTQLQASVKGLCHQGLMRFINYLIINKINKSVDSDRNDNTSTVFASNQQIKRKKLRKCTDGWKAENIPSTSSGITSSSNRFITINVDTSSDSD